MTKSMRNLLSISQIAESLNVGHKTVRRLVDSGELKAINVARKGAKRRTLRVTPESLEAFLCRRMIEGHEPTRRSRFDARYEAAVKRLIQGGKPMRRSKALEELEFLRHLHGESL